MAKNLQAAPSSIGLVVGGKIEDQEPYEQSND